MVLQGESARNAWASYLRTPRSASAKALCGFSSTARSRSASAPSKSPVSCLQVMSLSSTSGSFKLGILSAVSESVWRQHVLAGCGSGTYLSSPRFVSAQMYSGSSSMAAFRSASAPVGSSILRLAVGPHRLSRASQTTQTTKQNDCEGMCWLDCRQSAWCHVLSKTAMLHGAENAWTTHLRPPRSASAQAYLGFNLMA